MLFLKFLPRILIIIISAIATYQFALIVSSWIHPLNNVREVTWSELAVLDAVSNAGSTAMQKLEGEEVKLAGFVVPLTDNFKEIKEFLLVPDAMSCIHVPPPPSNQIVLVTLREPINGQLAYGPVWVRGHLKIKGIQSVFGLVAFQMNGQKVKIYEGKNWK